MLSTTFIVVVVIICIVTKSSYAYQFQRIITNRRSLHMIADGRVPLMGGNWKLNPTTTAAATSLASELAALTASTKGVDIVVFPPSPFLVPVYSVIENSNVKLGGQNCYHENSGAYTGAISTCMLKDVGVQYVLCGHSERRTLFKDKDDGINKKIKKILKDGLKAVLCIGETKEEYEAGLNQEVCAIQIMKDLKDITPEDMTNVIIAYEPVWAIGTGLVCPKEVAQDIHKYIRSLIAKKYGSEIARKIIIQYGGSVKPDNIKELMEMPDIDGALVGGASLTAQSFALIVNYNQ